MKPTYLKQSLLALLSTTLSAFADTHHKPLHTTLDPLVVTFSKTVQPLSKTPARVSRIGESEITTNPTLNLSEVLQKDAGIYIKQNGGIGQGTTLSLRGTNPNHTLLLKDNVRLNTPNTLTPTYPETLDLSDTQRVEILKGPASVQYGSDAIGGVVHMISQTPIKTGVSLTGIYGENNTHKAIAKGDLVYQDFYASLSGQKLETDGTRIFNTQGSNMTAPFEQEGYQGKIGYAGDKFGFSLSHAKNNGINTYSDNGGTSNTAKRHFSNTQEKIALTFKAMENLTVSAHHAKTKDRQKYVESWSTNEYNTDYKESDINARLNLNAHTVLFGATQSDTRYQDAYAYQGKKDIKSTGYYLQHQYKHDKFSTQAGIRLEDNERFGQHTVGQVAGRYHFTPTTSVFANVGTAFRAPSLNELYYNSSYSWSGITHTTKGNEQLKPEESTSYELGINHTFNDALTLSLSQYDTRVDGLIATVSDVATNVTTYENINKATFKGYEVALKYTQGDYYANLGYTHTKSTNNKTARPIAYRPKQTGTLTLGYDNGTVGTSISLIARGKMNADNTATPVQVAGYASVDVNTHWQITPYIKLFSNIKNIGDVKNKEVYNFGNWYINSGREANVGIALSY